MLLEGAADPISFKLMNLRAPVEEIERAERGFMTCLSCGRRSSQTRNSTFFLVAAVPETRPATNSIAIETFICLNERKQGIVLVRRQRSCTCIGRQPGCRCTAGGVNGMPVTGRKNVEMFNF